MTEWLDKTSILKSLSDQIKKQITALELFFTIPSTNTYLLEKSKTSGHVCLAEHQSGGRGRCTRNWVSPLGAGIYLSLRWHFSKPLLELGGLSLVVGLAVIKALEQYGVPALSLKWPNDVLSNHQKIAGILVELAGEHHGKPCAVMGIGVNVALSSEDGQAIKQSWTDVASNSKPPVRRNDLVALLLEALLTELALFERFGFPYFQKEWEKWDMLRGRPITLTFADQRTVSGIAQGIDEKGALLLQTGDTLIAYQGGEVRAQWK